MKLKNSLLFSWIIFNILSNAAFANVHTETEIRHLPTTDKIVALSFDDGPSTPYTEQILAILKKHDVKATFFMIGVVIKSHPDIAKKVIQAGHDIGNHSMHHDYISKKSVEAAAADIHRVDEIIRDLGYQGEIFFRSPFGMTSDNLRTALNQLHKRNFLFDFLSQDWENPPADVIYDRIIAKVKPGFIIVLHDGGKGRSNTVEATDRIITTLKARGYRFVTASEAMGT